MADPVGLVSLGLGAAKKAIKSGSAIRSRRRHLQALRYALDLASSILRDAEQCDDPVRRDAHNELLAPCIAEAREFLERVENRKWLASTTNNIWRASDDDAELKRLLSVLEGAPRRIDERIRDLRVSLASTQQQKELATLKYCKTTVRRTRHTRRCVALIAHHHH